MPELTIRRAINAALHEAMTADERVFVMGEDIALWGTGGGIHGVMRGLEDKFGTDRVRSTPISEEGFVAAATGAAMCGQKPVVEIMSEDFSLLAFNPIINTAAKIRYMFGEQFPMHLVIRCVGGTGKELGPHHTQSLETLFAHIPGLEVVVPGTANDARALLHSAIASPNPTIFCEQKGLYNVRGPIDDEVVPLGSARVARAGSDVTVIATQLMLHRALAAAEELSTEGIEVEIVDLRCLWPLDTQTAISSVKRTGRAIVAHEAPLPYGFGGEIVAAISEACFDELLCPVERIGSVRCPMPYAPNLEEVVVPTIANIVERLRSIVLTPRKPRTDASS